MRKVFLILILVSIVSFAFGQDKYPIRDIKPNMSLDKTQNYTLDIFNGLSFPQGNLNHFLKDGFNSGILIHKRFNKKLSIGLSANHSRFNHKYSFAMDKSFKHQELSTTSFDIGPQYNMAIGRFSLEFYGRSGLSIVNSPQSLLLYPETDVTITSLEAYKSTALITRIGANMTANITDGLKFYLSSEYITNLNSDLYYQTRDLSGAFFEDGSLNTDAANKLPYTNESLSLSMLNVNFGVRISFGGNKRKRHPNILYDSNGSKGIAQVYKTRNQRNNKVGRESKPKTDNYKLNRNNNSSFIDIDGKDESNLRAEDHNLNRSNNSSVIAPEPDEIENLVESKIKSDGDDGLADIPKEKLKLKTKAQLAKDRRQKKRAKKRAARKLVKAIK
ncbi:hypothetical protein L3073_17125 [Ancylomarina sp. DW003]|nr:hypothetical protein [Ancylomarina sp. DW003]MDE5423939.1 hypothetical protein [Ancylomarina sp. DW003]